VVHGWNFDALEAAVIAAVKSTYYQGSLTVKFESRADKIRVRADSWQARALSKTWVVVLLSIFLIYPFIWLYKRFAARGGGRWEVCGGAYALVSWLPSSPEDESAPPPPFSDAIDGWRTQGPRPDRKMVGMKEGEWFQKWEGTIKRAVGGRLKSNQPLTDPDGTNPAAMLLDGYRP
jgi:hypothetical protein